MSAASKRSAAQDQEAAAFRLLKTLCETDGVLAREGQGLVLRGENTARATGARNIPPALAQYCLAHDWLKLDGGVLRLTDAGQAWLRRRKARDDGFRQQHQLRAAREIELDGIRRPAIANDGESPLGWLRSRKDREGRPLISEAQYEAGERLRSDYWFAQLSPRVTANWQALAPRAGGRRGAPSDAAGLRDEVIAAKARVRNALAATGQELAGVLIDVCCELKGLEEAEKAQGWPARAGKVVLQIALNRLARHYGLIAEGSGGRRGLRHWGTEDYRPSLDAWQETDR